MTETDPSSQTKRTQGEMIARAARYAAALACGYLAGIAVGAQGVQRPPVMVSIALVAVALLFAFRRGQRSQSHAAADAAAAAISKAVAQAHSDARSQSINNVTIGGVRESNIETDLSRASDQQLMVLGGRSTDPDVRALAEVELRRRNAARFGSGADEVLGFELETGEVER